MAALQVKTECMEVSEQLVREANQLIKWVQFFWLFLKIYFYSLFRSKTELFSERLKIRYKLFIHQDKVFYGVLSI